ncbi:hypothetical protein MIMGU_mgv1a013840mg [Erythranthe guttata]|uniref:Uncharacterized protein n=2 Tax=Erythranthe guttata TaxID=4155 RepID=A0A022Q4K7_ERYGU|nr:hypothetical protein MIMGU_mgv1a013840mg [Erythranthe guttata]
MRLNTQVTQFCSVKSIKKLSIVCVKLSSVKQCFFLHLPEISKKRKGRAEEMAMAAKAYSPLLIRSMAAAQKPPSTRTAVTSKKSASSNQQVKLLTRVEQLRLLSKAERAGLLSAAENSGLSLSVIERLGLLSKAEEFGVLSAATDPGTPSSLLSLSLALLALGPVFVFLVPEDYSWEIGFQVVVALISVVGGSAAFAASNLVSTLQKST